LLVWLQLLLRLLLGVVGLTRQWRLQLEWQTHCLQPSYCFYACEQQYRRELYSLLAWHRVRQLLSSLALLVVCSLSAWHRVRRLLSLALSPLSGSFSWEDVEGVLLALVVLVRLMTRWKEELLFCCGLVWHCAGLRCLDAMYSANR
jgi:hypothetical protein